MELERKIFIAPDGAKIKYVDEGAGPAFLYVYGLGGSVASSISMVNTLKKYHRVVVFDQRGYGETEAVGDVGIHQSARDAKALMDSLDIDKYVMFGYSMGAAVSFSYIKQFGCGNLERVILGDMSPKLINEDGWNLGLYQGHYTREMYDADVDLICSDYRRFAMYLAEQLMFKQNPQDERDSYLSAEEIEARILKKEPDPIFWEVMNNDLVKALYEKRGIIQKYWITMANADFRPVLKEITVPAAIIYADPGSGYCPGTAEYMHSQIPDSVLCPMEGCTHMASAERGDLFMKYLLDFSFFNKD